MTTSVNQCGYEPKHKLFLSHSGAEKEFVEQLCVDLERNLYNPFFDKRHNSLEKGVPFPDTIFQVIKGCWVAILVLSEGFLSRSKWPMLELAAMAEAYAGCNKKLKILPLYLKLSREEFCSSENRKRWRKRWSQWAAKGSRGVDIASWMSALKLVDKMNGMHIETGTTEVAFRKLVVETICKICPNIVFDDSHVVGRDKFCQTVSNLFDELKCADKRGGHSMIGVFGVGGMGKTTLCQIMCNHYFGRFEGKVVHVNLEIKSFLEQKLKIIKKITGSQGMLGIITDPKEGRQLLKRCLSQNRLFLTLDGVSDDHEVMKEARWYMSQTYGEGSMIMVTSRSCEVLSTVLQAAGLQESEISERVMEVPTLNEMEAIQLFLQYGSNKHSDFESFSEDKQSRVLMAVRKGHFRNARREEQFHPLALKALRAQLSSHIDDPAQLLEKIENLGLSYSRTNIFSVLRTAYDALPVEERLIFMDIALYKPGCISTMAAVSRWLSIVHEMEICLIEDHLQSLKKKSLLEEGSLDYALDMSRRTMNEPATDLVERLKFSFGDSEVVVHDLYLQFATMEANNRGDLSESTCFASVGAKIVPIQMRQVPVGRCWPVQRLSLVRGQFSSLDDCNLRKWFCNLGVLKLEYLSKLTRLSVRGLSCLVNCDIFYCEQLQAVDGMETLQYLGWLRVARCEKLESFPSLGGLTRLKHVELQNSVIKESPEIVDCHSHLSELRLSGHLEIQSLEGIGSLVALRRMVIEWCPRLAELPSLQDYRSLLELHVSDCSTLCGDLDVSNLQLLQKLHLRDVGICELVGVGELRDLRKLVCENCRSLEELPDISVLEKLEELDVVFKLGILRSSVRHCKSTPLMLPRDIRSSRQYAKFDFDRLTRLQHMRRILVRLTEDFGFVNAVMKVMMQDTSSSRNDIPFSVMLLQGPSAAIGREARQNCFGPFPKPYSYMGVTLCPASADYERGASQIMLCFIYSKHAEKTLRQAVRKCWQVKSICYKPTKEDFIRYLDQEEVIRQSYRPFGLRLDWLGTRALDATGLNNLVTLLIEGCNVECVVHLGNLKKLVRLVVKGCKHLCDPLKLEGMSSLEYFECSGCDHYHEAKRGMSFVDCPKLSEICISHCKGLDYLFTDDVTPFTGLKKMEISSCGELKGFVRLRVTRTLILFPVLELLNCQNCVSLTDLPTFGKLSSIRCSTSKQIPVGPTSEQIPVGSDMKRIKRTLEHRANNAILIEKMRAEQALGRLTPTDGNGSEVMKD